MHCIHVKFCIHLLFVTLHTIVIVNISYWKYLLNHASYNVYCKLDRLSTQIDLSVVYPVAKDITHSQIT